MANVQVHRDDVTLDAPTLVEGLPGVGLVGKITADHLVEEFDMVHYASLHCDGLPEVAVYHEGESGVQAPVRLYADEDRDLLVLQSDVPVSPSAAEEFAACVSGWLSANDVTPIYLSGRPTEKDGVPSVWGVATDGAGDRLAAADIDAPPGDGAITGPTGALVYEAKRSGLGAVALVVEADPQFPDPEAARALLDDAIERIAGIDVETDRLVEHAEQITEAKDQLAQQMQDAGDESTQAKPLGMFQ